MPLITAKAPLHKHVPLIKFLGASRSKIPHNTAPQTVAPSKPTSSSSPNVTAVLFYESISAVPNSFRSRPLSQAEMDSILYGGAVWEDKPKPKKGK
ncbi:hypothetical protein BC829DRAFT_386223 [Chytridium lagenaria]|nr:hypothetical protein BC829DRAFT_386223 [Chytridium lagenaria]